MIVLFFFGFVDKLVGGFRVFSEFDLNGPSSSSRAFSRF